MRREVSQGQKHNTECMLKKSNKAPNHIGTRDGQGKDEAETARLTDVLPPGRLAIALGKSITAGSERSRLSARLEAKDRGR